MKLSTVFDKNELPIEDTLEKAKIVLDKSKGFVYKLLRMPQFNDEPKYVHYTAYTKKSSGNPSFSGIGCSLDEKKAQMKALAEAIERYSMYTTNNRKLLLTMYKKIGTNALDPTTIVSFSENQLKGKLFRKFRVNKDSLLKWVRGVSLLDGRLKYVPAQLISLVYKFEKNEPLIRIPITNGAATGSSMAGGVTRGIWELIERDAFMINYLNKLPRDRIITDDSNIQDILTLFSRYTLEVHSFDISTDIKVPTILSVVIDKTGKGPLICMGAKSNLDAKEALIGSIGEAAQVRMHMRKVLMTENIKRKKLNLSNYNDRMLYWNDFKMIKHLNFLLESKNIQSLSSIKSYKGDTLSNLKKTIKILKKKNFETVVVDITKPLIRRYGFKVPMVIIPNLQPFYLVERYPYFGGKRLYEVPEILGYTNEKTTEDQLNKIPHPF